MKTYFNALKQYKSYICNVLNLVYDSNEHTRIILFIKFLDYYSSKETTSTTDILANDEACNISDSEPEINLNEEDNHLPNDLRTTLATKMRENTKMKVDRNTKFSSSSFKQFIAAFRMLYNCVYNNKIEFDHDFRIFESIMKRYQKIIRINDKKSLAKYH